MPGLAENIPSALKLHMTESPRLTARPIMSVGSCAKNVQRLLADTLHGAQSGTFSYFANRGVRRALSLRCEAMRLTPAAASGPWRHV